MKLKCNCCDGIYNSLDVHFTSVCDNKCAHCVDLKFSGLGINKPDVSAIVATICDKADDIDDVLFLGGEPCLYLDELLDCVKRLRERTQLKLYVTTSMPKVCYDNQDKFFELLELLDGLNISAQSHNETVACAIRRRPASYDRQAFYASLPMKEKIRINLNVVKPFLYTREALEACLRHYDSMGFASIKLSEIQHGSDYYVSFADVFGLDLPSAYAHGCQTYLDTSKILPEFTTPLLLKRSCFLCEDTLKASLADGVKVLTRFFVKARNNYGVVYEDGSLKKGWV